LQVTTADDLDAVEDQNTLVLMGLLGELVWNGARWVKPS